MWNDFSPKTAPGRLQDVLEQIRIGKHETALHLLETFIACLERSIRGPYVLGDEVFSSAKPHVSIAYQQLQGGLVENAEASIGLALEELEKRHRT